MSIQIKNLRDRSSPHSYDLDSGQTFQQPQSKTLITQPSIVSFGYLSQTEPTNYVLESNSNSLEELYLMMSNLDEENSVMKQKIEYQQNQLCQKENQINLLSQQRDELIDKLQSQKTNEYKLRDDTQIQNMEIQIKTLQKQIFLQGEQQKKQLTLIKEDFWVQIQNYKDQISRQVQITNEYQLQIKQIETESNKNVDFLKQTINQMEIQNKEFTNCKSFKIQGVEQNCVKPAQNVKNTQLLFKLQNNQTSSSINSSQTMINPLPNKQYGVQYSQPDQYGIQLQRNNNDSTSIDFLNKPYRNCFQQDSTPKTKSQHPINQLRMYSLATDTTVRSPLLSNTQINLKQGQTVRKTIFDQTSGLRLARSHSFIN